MPSTRPTNLKGRFTYQSESHATPHTKPSIDSLYQTLDCSLLFIAKQRLNYLRRREDLMPSSLEHLERICLSLNIQQWAYYKLLGLPIDTTAQQIASRYRKISGICHPDKFVTQSTEQQNRARTAFESVKRAHLILSTPKTRAVYDYWSLSQSHEVEFTRFLKRYK